MPCPACRPGLLCTLLAAWCFSLPAGAATPETADQVLLSRLASPQYAVRDAASRSLLQDRALTLSRITTLYQQADALEQRHRLLDVARHHALQELADRASSTSPRRDASIGIAHQVLGPAETGLDRPAVLVRQTLPGFPGYAHLQPGDMILTLGNRTLPTGADEAAFVQMVREHQPGERITLTIHREGQPLNVTLPLASADMLAAVYARSGSELAEPYRTICHRVRQAMLTGDALDLDRLAQLN